MPILILLLTWIHPGTPYNLLNNLLERTQPVTALLSTRRDCHILWCLAQLLILSALFLPHSACRILQELFNILSVMILCPWTFTGGWFTSGHSLNELKLFLGRLWNTEEKSKGILSFFESRLFLDHLGAVTLEGLLAMSTVFLMKPLNSSRGKVCFHQSYATSQEN